MSSDLKTLTLQEVAEILGVHRLTARKLMERGEIRARKSGKHWYITEAAVREFLLVPGSRGMMRRPAAAPQPQEAV
jgi:excisionase family DNA binding protein